MKAVLDTSVLIATDVSPLESELAISSASIAGLHFGVLVSSNPAVRAGPVRAPNRPQRPNALTPYRKLGITFAAKSSTVSVLG